MKRTLALSLSLVLLLSACGAAPEEEKPKEPKKVAVLQVEEQDFTPTLEVSGTLQPLQEAVLAAETTGTVDAILATEGDEVRARDTLLRFRSSDNQASVQLQSTEVSLMNAEKIVNLARKQAEENLRMAKIGVAQAETALANEMRSNTSTQDLTSSQSDVYESALELAKLQEDNASKALEELKENLDLQENNLEENKENTINTAFVNIRTSLKHLDEMLRFSEEKRNTSSSTYIGFKDPALKRQTFDTAKTAWVHLLELENKESWSIDEVQALAEDTRDALQMMDELLQKSVSDNDFDATLANYQSTMSSYRLSLENTVASLDGIAQAIDQFYTQKPQQLRAAEVAKASATQQRLQAEDTLSQIGSSGDVSEIQTENAIASAESALESAKAQYDLVLQQNEYTIQQAVSQRDSAWSAVRSAEAGVSKLSVLSPIDGVILEKSVEVGDTVNMGSPLFFVGETETLLLKADVPVESIPQLKEGMLANVMVDHFGEKRGVLTKIYPSADKTTRRVGIEVSIRNLGRDIPANIFARANILLKKERGLLFIPRKSLISQNPPTVFVVTEENKLERRTVEIGRSQENSVEVLSGLEVGDIILAEAILGVVEGDEVEPMTNEEEVMTNDKVQMTDEAEENEELEMKNEEEMTDDKVQMKGEEEETMTNDRLQMTNAEGDAEQDGEGKDSSSSKSESGGIPEDTSAYCRDRQDGEELTLFWPENNKTYTEQPIAFLGETPAGTNAITINGYKLTTYNPGFRCFQYNAAMKFSNLKEGENTYTIRALGTQGVIDEYAVTLTFER